MVETTSALEASSNAAVLVCLDVRSEIKGDPKLVSTIDWQEEAKLLAESAGYVVAAVINGKRDRPDASTFAGSGKVEEIAAALEENKAHNVIFNHRLSPVQVRNLEKILNAPVVDRTELILDIFADRAQTHEGKLQVELAKLQHQSTRLIRGWTHLERQRGGIGGRGGPGEKQLELDRRMIGDKVKRLKAQLEKLTMQRHTQRAARSDGGTFRVAVVGYTNAGKSTLFNRVAREKTMAQDMLFATLDTMTRKVYLDNPDGEGLSITLTDTVGFIRDLPTTLVQAFRATLEETNEADFLLHIVDAANPARDEQILEVRKVLEEIGAAQLPELLIQNKIDRKPGMKATTLIGDGGQVREMHVSALNGDGIFELRAHLLALAKNHKANLFTKREQAAIESISASVNFEPSSTSLVNRESFQLQ